MRGRKPKPTELKKLAGNPGKRKLNPQPAKLTADIPQCPRHLNAEARKEWHRTVKRLHQAGLFKPIDRAALAAYCSAYARWAKAEEKLQEEVDLVLKSKTGYFYQSPWLAILNKALDQMKAFLVEFGMTPSSRSRISVKEPEEMDELERLLFGENVSVGDDNEK